MLRPGVGLGANIVHSPCTPRGGTAVLTHGRRRHLCRLRSNAKKSPEEEERGGGDANALSGVLPGRSVLLRAGAVIFALGFVDAGYSGDWSRIGAISKDTEDLLKLGAYAVVPLCLALALAVPGDSGGES
ncbi:uncharacterized protein [Lolium perenne]|uniref:uncharacterized protein n=1 Tax=Lolium perenne TaxID=4522 RepID=UPI0021EAD7EC|nr:uncharacterized protein LOC127349114 [Lolium perenne]